MPFVPATIIFDHSLDSIIPDIALYEEHNDEVRIPQHPVEQGATITDNFIKMPSEVQLQYGWSVSAVHALGDPSYTNYAYAQLLTLQASGRPFNIVTTKRLYENMIMLGLRTRTDKENTFSMITSIRCQQIILVSTSTVTLDDGSTQASPQQTSSILPKGQIALKSAPSTFNAASVPASVSP